MAGMERGITDPFLKRSAAALIVVSNAVLAFLLFEHGGSIEGLLYDSRLLVANGMSPIVAMKLQRAWSSITRWTLQHPYLRTLYSMMLANGLYGDTVLLQVPWLLSSFFETAAQLVLILASLWIMVLHFEPMNVPHILSIMTQLLLIQLYSGMWTLVALWTFQSSIEEMIEVIAVSRGPTIVLSYDPHTQRMTAREMSPPRLGRRTTPTAGEGEQEQLFFRPPGRFASPSAPEDDAEELQSQDDSSDGSASQTSSKRTGRKDDKRSSEGITRGPQIERDSIESDEESTEAKDADSPSAGKETGTPKKADEFRSDEIGTGVELITLGESDSPASPTVDPSTQSTAKAMAPQERSKVTKVTAKGGCYANAPCRTAPTDPSDAPAANAVNDQTITESPGHEIAQTQGFQPGFQGCDVPDAACKGKQTVPPGSGPGFTKIVKEEGDKYLTKQFISSRPPEPADNARYPQTPATTAADATGTDGQDGPTCDPEAGATVCPGTGQPTRPQGWICPPKSQCWIKESEIRSTEAKTEPQDEDKPKPATFKDEVPLDEHLIVVDVGAEVMSEAQHRVAEEASEAIPIHFTQREIEVPVVEEEIVESDDEGTPVILADAPPDEEEVDDLFSQNPTEGGDPTDGGEDRLRGGEQAFEDNCCLSNVTCRVHEKQCPMHVAMQAGFKVESVVDVSKVIKESSVISAEIILSEGDEMATFASEASYSHPPDEFCGVKELYIPVRKERGEKDTLPIDTSGACSPDGVCKPNEQDISVDSRAGDKNVSVYCAVDTKLGSATYNVPNVSILPSECECPRESNLKGARDGEIKLDQGGTTLSTGNTYQENTPKKLSILKEEVFVDDQSHNKVDIQVDFGIKYADATACNVCHATEIYVQTEDCENPPSSIYETEGIKPGGESVAVVLNSEMNEKIYSEVTEQHVLKGRVSFANEQNWMCSNENITRMKEIGAFEDVWPDDEDKDFAFSDDSAFIPTGLQASRSPISHCPEKWEGLVHTTNSKGDSASNHLYVDDERNH